MNNIKNNNTNEFNTETNPEIMKNIGACQVLCHELNQISIMDYQKRLELVKRILGEIEENCQILTPFHCAFGFNIKVGKNFMANYNCSILDAAEVKFGDNVMIGPNCSFYTSGHDLDPKRRKEGWGYAYPIIVGNNVWFGGDVVVVASKPGGIVIGDNSVIGAGSVVTKDIPANSIAVGNPCKVVKKIQSNE